MNILEKSGLEIIAKLMAVSGRTAPKSGGIDHVRIIIAGSREQKSIAATMKKIGEEICRKLSDNKLGKAVRLDWQSDARTITESGLLMLIGVEGRKILGLNCGGCGFPACSHKAGVAALRLGILKPCDLIIGIPLSATGKNIYFDRPDKLEAWKIIKANKNK